MAGESEEIAVQILYIHSLMGSRLGSVKHHHGAMGMSPLNEGLGIEINAQYVGYFGKSQDFHSGVVDFLQFFFREMTGFLIYINVVQHGAGFSATLCQVTRLE